MKKLLPWMIALAAVTMIFATFEIVVQQSLRIGANDPQIQLAEDAASALNGNASPRSLVAGKVNLEKSLAPFVIIYDKAGQPVAGNGYLGNQLPVVPPGVLSAARGHDYSFVTWQPEDGVRLASVSVAANNYYVVSGRSLKEVEKREKQTLELSTLGWACTVVIILAGAYMCGTIKVH
jgi:hypothetical protein